jgi:hypothetical protein
MLSVCRLGAGLLDANATVWRLVKVFLSVVDDGSGGAMVGGDGVIFEAGKNKNSSSEQE